MEFLKTRRKGAFFAWLYGLGALLAISVIWIIFSNVYFQYLEPYAKENINQSAEALDTLAKLSAIWNIWPLIIIVGVILLWVVAAQKREPDSYYR